MPCFLFLRSMGDTGHEKSFQSEDFDELYEWLDIRVNLHIDEQRN